MNHHKTLLATLSILFGLLIGCTNGFAQDKKELVPLEKIRNLGGADLDLVNNHDPAVEQANFDLLDGFEVNLFATDPMLANPVHMTWGPDGKLYVGCSWAYPQLKPGEKANDKIIVLEDTDDDGQADKSTVFADGLYLPTGLELANGGVYVAQSPHILFLKDTDGDGKADHREVALTGFGIEDSHHTNSAWRRGPGGWIYFQEGVFLNTQVETEFGTVRNNDGGVYQFNPRTGQLRVFANINVGNPWGHVFDDWGQSFLVDNPRINYLSPTTGNQSKKRRPFTLTQTEKQCGGDLVSGTHMPPELQGQLLSGRFKSRTVIRYEFTEDRAGYTANVLEPLMSSRHPNFRPVDVKIGPDGAVYVADWYNSIINHAGHDFRDPRRDHEHGRIWRITAKDRPLVEKPKLEGQSVSDLLEQLKSPNAWTRHYARKVLSERDPDKVSAAINQWVEALDENDSRNDHHLIEALWTLQNVERTNEPLLKKALHVKTGQARAAAARVIRYWQSDLSDPVDLVNQAAADPFPRVRMEAALSAGFIPDGKALVAAMHVLDQPMDPFIDTALEQTIDVLGPFISDNLEFSKPAHKERAHRTAGIGVAGRLKRILRNGTGSPAEIKLAFEQFMRNPEESTIKQMVNTVTARRKEISPEVLTAAVDSLVTIGRRNKFPKSKLARPLVGLLNDASNEQAVAAFDVIAAWKIPKGDRKLAGYVKNETLPMDVRIAAARALGEFNSPTGKKTLVDFSSEKHPIDKRIMAIHGLVKIDLPLAAKLAAEIFAESNSAPDASSASASRVGLVEAFVKLKGGSESLASAISTKQPHPAVRNEVTEFANRTGTLPPNLAKHFRPESNKALLNEMLAEDITRFADDALKNGDPGNGELVFRRKNLSCINCHGIAQVGPKIGPDLAAVGAASKVPYLVDSILRPNKAFAEHYETYIVLTIDGEILTGTMAYQNEEEVALRIPEKKTPVVILKEDIEDMKQGNSLMPEGLAEQFADRQELLDLVSFLAQLGRPGPYMTSTKPVIRRWKLLASDRPAAELSLADIPENADWSTGYSLVQGELPAPELGRSDSIFIRGAFEVQAAGRIGLDFDSTKGIKVWLDENDLADLNQEFSVEKGRHELTILIDNAIRGNTGIRVELIDDPNKRARYQVEGGQ